MSAPWGHRLVLGTWLNFEHDQGAVDALVEAALELGISAFDTADLYGDGAAERLLGRALGRHPRERVTIIGKVGRPTSLGRGLSRPHVERSLTRSLEHLGTDHLDVLLAHAPDPAVAPEALAAGFDDLVDDGRIRAWGTSQFPPLSLLRLKHATRQPTGMALEQPSYSLLERWIENGRLPACRGLAVDVVPHSTLAAGVLTGKYAGRVPKQARGQARPDVLTVDGDTVAASRAIVEVASAHGATALQAALVWVLAQPGISGAVVGARTPEQLAELVDAARYRPPPALLAALDQRFPGPRRRRDRLRAAATGALGSLVGAAKRRS